MRNLWCPAKRILGLGSVAALISLGACGAPNHPVTGAHQARLNVELGGEILWVVHGNSNTSIPVQGGANAGSTGTVSAAADTTYNIEMGRSNERGGLAMVGRHRLVGTNARGQVFCLDAATGQEIWRKTLTQDPFLSAPTVGQGRIFVAVPDGTVRALSLEGEELWQRELPEVFQSAARQIGDALILNSVTDKVTALDVATGRTLWSYNRPSRVDFTVAGMSTPMALGARVLVGFSDGTLAAIDPGADGSQGHHAWLADLAGSESRLIDVDSTPLVLGDSVFASSYAGGFYSLNATSGEVQWHVHLKGAGSPAWTGQHVVTATADGQVVWIDPASGSVQGVLNLDGSVLGEVYRSGDLLVIPVRREGVYLVDAHRPILRAFVPVSSGITATMAVDADRFFILSDMGTVQAVQVRWQDAW